MNGSAYELIREGSLNFRLYERKAKIRQADQCKGNGSELIFDQEAPLQQKQQ